VLCPQRTAPVAFDELTQSLSWPLMDAAGNWIALSLDHDLSGSGLGARRIDALEAAQNGAARPFAIVALARPDGDRLALTPMTLWGEAVAMLDFPQRPRPAEPRLLADAIARIRRARERRAAPPPMDTAVRTPVTLALAALAALAALVASAEDGNGGATRRTRLAPLARRFELASLQPLARLFSRAAACEPADAPEAALTAAWAAVTLQRLARRLPVSGDDVPRQGAPQARLIG
jgi:hypothetical protein